MDKSSRTQNMKRKILYLSALSVAIFLVVVGVGVRRPVFDADRLYHYTNTNRTRAFLDQQSKTTATNPIFTKIIKCTHNNKGQSEE
jgi:hypothetical protein